ICFTSLPRALRNSLPSSPSQMSAGLMLITARAAPGTRARSSPAAFSARAATPADASNSAATTHRIAMMSPPVERPRMSSVADSLAAGTSDHRLERVGIDRLRHEAHHAVGHRDVEAVLEHAAQFRQLLLCVEGHIVRLRPDDVLAGLDGHDGVAVAVGDVRELDAGLALEDGPLADEHLIEGAVLLRRLAAGWHVGLRHEGDELLVVWAVPRLVQLELLVQRVLL